MHIIYLYTMTEIVIQASQTINNNYNESYYYYKLKTHKLKMGLLYVLNATQIQILRYALSKILHSNEDFKITVMAETLKVATDVRAKMTPV